MSRLSIVIPVYNAERWIERCAQSLLHQDYDRDAEIIFVDNNSTDGGIAKIPRHDRIRVLSEPEQGAYAARNTGVAAATGDILLFTDPDCVLDPGWIRAHLRALDHHNAMIALGRVIHGGDRRTMHLLSEYDHARQLTVFRRHAARHYFGYTNNLAITRAAWDQIGPFEHRQRGADTVLVHRAVQAAGPRAVRYAPDARTVHLEVDSVAIFLKKMHTYGKSSKRFRNAVAPAPPTARIRRRALALALSKSSNRLDALVLPSMLAAGVVAWQTGYHLTSTPAEHTTARDRP